MFLYIVFSFIFFWLLQNVIHETSHAFVGFFIEKRKIISFKPWPHFYRGIFFFSRYELSGDSEFEKICVETRFRHIAPFWAGLLFSLVWVTLFVLSGNLIFSIPFSFALIDSLFFWWGYFLGSNHCDGKRYKNFVSFFGDSI